tara:strand:- start:2101 stop:2379 length:279 start_codon:yes stop_codon:yes gene_type:complete
MKEKKSRIIKAAYKAVDELIKVAEQEIIKLIPEDELAADRLKNAAATKKLAIFDAFAILEKIEEEKEKIDAEKNIVNKKVNTKQGFAERRSK